jgi:hypothetical protein
MFTDIPLVCTKAPGKNSDQAMWSLGGAAVRRPEFRRPRRRSWPGEWLKRIKGWLGIDSRAWWWPGGTWRVWPIKQGGGRRLSSSSGEGAARPGQQASVEALLGPREMPWSGG